MTVEVQNLTAEVVQDDVPVNEAPVQESVNETPSDEVKSDEQAKTFTQEELDKIITRRLAKEARKWEREQAAKRAEAELVKLPVQNPQAGEYANDEEYAKALILREAEKLAEAKEQQKRERVVAEAYLDREEAARDKYDDFEQVAYNPNLSVTGDMADCIRMSDIGPDIAYHLGSNPKEADRISRLPPLAQAREIGKLEAKLLAAPAVKAISQAPEPIRPITSKQGAGQASSFDTTDPRSVKTMSTSEWIAAERARQIRKLESQR